MVGDPMAKRRDDLRLFEHAPDRAHRRDQTKKRHLHTVETSEQARLNADGASILIGQDGLPVRVVKPHSAQKARLVSRDLGTVTRAMNRQWFDVHYLEVFSGPGVLLDEALGKEIPGSPLEALGLSTPFDRCVFSDFSESFVTALDSRIGMHPGVNVLQGDANDPAHLKRVCDLIDPRALVMAYLDPAKPNLHWSTVAYLADRFRFLDFIINLPHSGIHRSLAIGSTDGPARVLNHPDPESLLRPDAGKVADAIRAHYDDQLRSIGFEYIARRCVRQIANNSPLYDVVLASRHPKAVELWEKANKLPAEPQLGLAFDNF